MQRTLGLFLTLVIVYANARTFHLQNNCPQDLKVSAVCFSYGVNVQYLDNVDVVSGKTTDVTVDVNFEYDNGWWGYFYTGDNSIEAVKFNLPRDDRYQDGYQFNLSQGFDIAMEVNPPNGCTQTTCRSATDCDQTEYKCPAGDYEIVFCP